MYGTNSPPRALIAAASRVTLGKMQRVGEPWQENLWDIYERLGPVWYGMNFKRNAAMRVNYFAAEITEDYEEPIPTENQQVIDAVDRLGNLGEIVGDFTIQENVAGEGFLFGRDDEDFTVYSSLEVNQKRRENLITDEDYLLRIWRTSPKKRKDPDSSLRSVQAQCEQLLLLNDEIGATAMSRIPAGFFLVPNELSFATHAEDYPEPEGDEFMAEIIEIATTAINDPDSAARVAPNVIRGPAEFLKEVRYVDISRQMDETFANMREELLRQIAGGINLPAEILTGLADLNHWSLWGVDESTAKHHVDPDVLHILAGLTEGYLYPYLEEASVSDFKRYLIWRDYSDLTSRPLSVEQALAMNEAGIVNDEYVRRVANVPEDMAGDGQPRGQLINPDIQSNREPPALVAAGVNLKPLEDIDRRLATEITEASEAAFERALERAGAKVRTKTQKDRQISAAIEGVDNLDVTRHLGHGRIETLQLTADQLIPADTFDNLSRRLKKLVKRGQIQTRDELEAMLGVTLEEFNDDGVDIFIAALLTAATARLFTASPDRDPAETGEFSEEISTASMVVDLLTRAGGAEPGPETARGLALGERTRAAFRDAGYRVEATTWQWGYWRTPQNRYEPHYNLDGEQSFGQLEINGYYPGDHNGCSCELVPTFLPA